ncbi:MAG: hypothetical protein ACI4MJ_12885 [Aristaeellaceae bacterium]
MRLPAQLHAWLWRLRPLSLPEGWSFCGHVNAPIRRVVVDTTLLMNRRHVSLTFAPFVSSSQMTLRAGSGFLLMGAAITVMADTTPDASALLSLAATMGFKPEKFLQRCPVLGVTSLQGITGKVVRDGKGRRAYFLSSPARLASVCGLIWEGGERPMTDEDICRLPRIKGTHYALATAPIEEGGLGKVTYLGSLLVEDAPSPAVLEAMGILRAQGFDVVAGEPSNELIVSSTGDVLVLTDRKPSRRIVPTLSTSRSDELDPSELLTAVQAVVRRTCQVGDQFRAIGHTLLMLLLCGLVMQLNGLALAGLMLLMLAASLLGGNLMLPAKPLGRRWLATGLPCLLAWASLAFLSLTLPDSLPALGLLIMAVLCAMLLPWLGFSRRVSLLLNGASLAVGLLLIVLLSSNLPAAAFSMLSGCLCAVLYLALLPRT